MVGIRHASLLFPVEVIGGLVNAVLVVLAVNVLTHINSYLVCLLTIALLAGENNHKKEK